MVNFTSDNCAFVRKGQWSFQKTGVSRFPPVDGSLTISVLLNLLHFYQTFSIDKYKYRLRIFQEQISPYNKIVLNLTPLFYGNIKSSDGIKHRHVCFFSFSEYCRSHSEMK